MPELTEKAKMLAGEPYSPMDPELAAERKAARRLTRAYNDAEPDAFAERAAILRQLLGSVHKTALLEPPFHCDYGYNISLGKAFFANFECVFLDANPIIIGDHVMLGPKTQIYTAGHPIDPEKRASFSEFAKPVKIGDRVWIGGGAILCPGVEIGEETVIGAGSVVTKSIPSRVVAVGNPCRAIRKV